MFESQQSLEALWLLIAVLLKLFLSLKAVDRLALHDLRIQLIKHSLDLRGKDIVN